MMRLSRMLCTVPSSISSFSAALTAFSSAVLPGQTDGVILRHILRIRDLQAGVGIHKLWAGPLSMTTQSTRPFSSACTAVIPSSYATT